MRYTRKGSSQVSGQVLDLDFDEQFIVSAFNANGDLVDSQVLAAGDPETGDCSGTDHVLSTGNQQ